MARPLHYKRVAHTEVSMKNILKTNIIKIFFVLSLLTVLLIPSIGFCEQDHDYMPDEHELSNHLCLQGVPDGPPNKEDMDYESGNGETEEENEENEGSSSGAATQLENGLQKFQNQDGSEQEGVDLEMEGLTDDYYEKVNGQSYVEWYFDQLENGPTGPCTGGNGTPLPDWLIKILENRGIKIENITIGVTPGISPDNPFAGQHTTPFNDAAGSSDTAVTITFTPGKKKK